MNSNAELNVIAKLDLDPIKVKLMHKESGEGWTLAQANAVEFEYRRFLSLMKLFPHEQVAPLFDVDIFWHYHILDTMKYAADCENIFGYFLHHFPYTGLRGEDDEAAHQRVGVRMQELYEATFGETYVRQQAVRAETAITAYSMPISMNAAQNDSNYSGLGASATGKTAYSMPVSASRAETAKMAYSMPVAPGRAASAKTAYSMPVAAGSATAKTAYSMPLATKVAEDDQLFSLRPILGTAKTAYSMPLSRTAAENDSFFTVRPVLGTAKTAYSMPLSKNAAQNDSFFSVRPALANAA